MKLSAFLLLLLAAPQEPASEISGVVRDERGDPVAGAEIFIRPDRAFEPRSTRTDDEGRFLWVAGESDREPYAIAVAAEGFVLWTRDGVDAGAELAVTLSSGRGIEGVVLDARTGEPIEGARVEASPTRRLLAFAPASSPGLGRARTTTDARGRFRLEGVPEDDVTLWASAASYGRVSVGVSAEDVETRIALPPGVGVRGVVVGPDGEPLEGARVVAIQDRRGVARWPSQVNDETDGSGGFALYGLEPGRYRVLVTHDELAFRIVPDVVVESADVVLPEAALEPGGAIVGRMVDLDGEPVSGRAALRGVDGEWMPVSLMSIAGLEVQDGRFRFDDLPAGEYALSLEPSGFLSQSLTVHLEPREKPLDLGDVVFGGGLSVSGFVVDETGAPIEGATVHARPPSYVMAIARGIETSARAETDVEGAFEMAGLESGIHVLGVAAPGFAGTLEEVRVEAGATDVVLTLERAGSVRARVVDEAGASVEDVDVSVSSAPRRRSMRYTLPSEDGRVIVENLHAGAYVLEFASLGLKPTRVMDVEVEAGEVTDVGTVVLTKGGTIRGWVLDPDDNPLPGAQVRAGTATPFFVEPITTDANGYFEVAGLQDGVVDVRVHHADYASAVVQDVELRAEEGPATIRVRMGRGGRIEGVVRSRDGAGIPGRIIRVVRGNETTTEADGTFRLENVNAGTNRVQLLASDPNYAATVQEQEVEILEDQATFVEFVSRQVIVSGTVSKGGVSVGGAHVAFRPVDAPGGFGISGAGVPREVRGPLALNAMTTPDGFYELYVDVPEAYEARVTAADGETRFPSQTLTVPDVATHVADIVIASSSLRGQVVSKETQEPVRQASVRVFPMEMGPAASTAGFARTDAHGGFHVEIEPGRYRLQVRAEGFSPLERTVSVSETSPSERLIELDPGRVVRGLVVDGNGNPPSHFYVRAVEDEQPPTDPPRLSDWAYVEPDGTFELSDLASVRYNVLAGSDLDGFAFAAGVEPGAELTFRLRPAAWIHVRVVDAEGIPVSRAPVVVSAIGGRKARGVSGRTDAEGTVELWAPAGSLQLKAVGPDDAEGSTSVQAGEGQRVPARIVLRAPAR